MLSHSLKVTPQITMYFLWWQDIHMTLNQYWVPFAHLYLTCFPCTLFYLINDVLTGAIFFLLLLLSGLLSMQWIAEVVTLNQALSQYGHLVQWWMTREQKVISPIIFWDPPFSTHLYLILLFSLHRFHVITVYLNGYLSTTLSTVLLPMQCAHARLHTMVSKM